MTSGQVKHRDNTSRTSGAGCWSLHVTSLEGPGDSDTTLRGSSGGAPAFISRSLFSFRAKAKVTKNCAKGPGRLKIDKIQRRKAHALML